MKYAVYPFKRENKYRLYIRFNDHKGRQRHLSTGVTYPLDASDKERDKAKEEAERKAKDLLIDHLQDQHLLEDEKKNKFPKLSEFLQNDYFPHKRLECAESTLVRYKISIEHFLRIVGDHRLNEYDRKMIYEFRRHRFNKDEVCKSTIDIELRSIKAAFSWAFKNNHLEKHPYRGGEFMFKDKKTKRPFKVYELEKLLTQTEGTLIGLVIRLAYVTGMRIGEMSNITWHMINLKKRFIAIPESITKRGERKVPLETKALNIVRILELKLNQKMKKSPTEYQNKTKMECYLLQKERGHGQYAIRSIQQKFRRCMNQAGLPKELTFHCLRHSYATHLLEDGAGLNGVSKLLGHTTPAITEEFYDDTDALDYRGTADRF